MMKQQKSKILRKLASNLQSTGLFVCRVLWQGVSTWVANIRLLQYNKRDCRRTTPSTEFCLLWCVFKVNTTVIIDQVYPVIYN